MTCENCYNKKACLKKAETCDLKSVKMHNISFWDSAESCEFFLNKEEIEGAGVLEKKEREVMKTIPEYIEREALKKALKENHDAIMQDPTYGTQRKWWEELRYNRVRSILSKIPAAGVAEVRHGELVEYWGDNARAKAEAVNEFAERLKKECVQDGAFCYVSAYEIDNLVKEMVGDVG